MTGAVVEIFAGRQRPPRWARMPLAVLRGLGFLYGAVQWLRAAAYRHGWPQPYRAPCPVISVGNLAAGGTGKTPMAVWLAKRLVADGHRVAVVSRGYRQEEGRPVTVVSDGRGLRLTPPAAADEAAMVAARLPAVAVVTAPVRWRGIDAAVRELGCDCVLLDDAFQHLAVARDLDLCLLDAERPFANGAVIPGGLLREFPSALGRADCAVLTRAGVDDGVTTVAALRGRFPRLAVAVTRHAVGGVVRLGGAGEGGDVAGSRLGCFCGIARPDAFYAAVKGLGVEVVHRVAFGDHHPFSAGDLQTVAAAAAAAGATGLICTEKDAVKIDPAWSPLPVWVVRLELEVVAGGDALWRRVAAVVGRPPALPMDSREPARPGLLIDRDGTLIEDRDYLADPDEVVLLPGAAAAIGAANRAGVPVVLVSNQSGIGRGYFGEAELQAVNRRIETLLAAEGAHLDGLYHCPHAPDAGCDCRKPAPGMARQAAADLGLDLARAFVVGDKGADLDLARAVAATPLLVRTGYGRETEAAGGDAEAVFDNLAAAIRWVVARIAAPL